jgi:localization factor PodJL
LRGTPAKQASRELLSERVPEAPDAPAHVPGAKPAHANQTHANPAHANPAHANPAHANPAHANPAHANPAYSRPTYSRQARVTDWAPLQTDLPPDYPIEPNHRYSPAERVAASQVALGSPLGTTRASGTPDVDAKASFIAAARRAAQAASSQLIEHVPDRDRVRGEEEIPSTAVGSHARILLIAASVVMVVLGSLQVFTGFFSRPSSPVAHEKPSMSTSNTPIELEAAPAPAGAPNWQPPMLATDDVLSAPNAGILPPPEHFAPASTPASTDLSASRDRTATGSVRQPSAAPASAPAGLPAMITGGLRAAATRGDPAAEFEVAVRLAEGRGMAQDFTAAAGWFERAARQGLVPAQFRLAGLYEKGTGVKKDLDAARRLYLAASNGGHAKAMHNLAVIYAEGADGKPDYQAAVYWFRRAADHGVIDSQYNLGILYARGIGVETNLAEAYKWFALAAREGDRESTRKRDELGTRLDQATAAAAHAAVRTWVAKPQPEAATQVKGPAGGWDGTPAAAPARRRVTSDTKGPNKGPNVAPNVTP